MTTGFRLLAYVATLLLLMGGTAAAASDFSQLAARYQEARSDGHKPPRSAEWCLVRAGDQVEFAREGGYAELWERDARGDVSWRRIFHSERKLVAYTPGELKTQGRALPWATVNTIFDAAQLTRTLRKVEETTFLGRRATRYAGMSGGLDVEVVWLDAEKLPARVVRRDRMHTYHMLVLKELHAAPPPAWPRADPARAAGYEQIDGADLGDREYDPFVQKVLAMDGHHHAH